MQTVRREESRRAASERRRIGTAATRGGRETLRLRGAHRFELPEQACAWYVPDAHAEQVAHTASLLAPHAAAAYCPAPHAVHGAHTVSAAAEHA